MQYTRTTYILIHLERSATNCTAILQRNKHEYIRYSYSFKRLIFCYTEYLNERIFISSASEGNLGKYCCKSSQHVRIYVEKTISRSKHCVNKENVEMKALTKMPYLHSTQEESTN